MMEHSNLQFVENTFFAAKLVAHLRGIPCWEIIRKVDVLPGVKGELLEVVAQCFREQSELFFLCDVTDYDLSADLCEIGVFREGYLSQLDQGGIPINGFGEVWNAQFKSIDELDIEKPFRKAVYRTDQLKHSLNMGNDLFLESFFKRDRIYWGLTEQSNTFDPRRKIDSGAHDENQKSNNWDHIIKSRRSANSFSNEGLSAKEINEVLKASLIYRDDGSKFYGSAGGFDLISTYLVIKNSPDLSPGIYKLDIETRNLVYVQSFKDFDLINNFLFLDSQLDQAATYLFFTLSFNEISRKYGQRSIRFSLLTLGGALQQLHLASTAQGLNYRTIGGFDELQCSKILALPATEFLTCAAVLGK